MGNLKAVLPQEISRLEVEVSDSFTCLIICCEVTRTWPLVQGGDFPKEPTNSAAMKYKSPVTRYRAWIQLGTLCPQAFQVQKKQKALSL